MPKENGDSASTIADENVTSKPANGSDDDIVEQFVIPSGEVIFHKKMSNIWCSTLRKLSKIHVYFVGTVIVNPEPVAEPKVVKFDGPEWKSSKAVKKTGTYV